MSDAAYIDSNVFIFPIIYGDSGNGAEATHILRRIESRQLTAYTSVLTWDEVVWVVRKSLGEADAIESGRKLVRFPNLRFIEASESIVAKGQSLIEKYQLKPRDAIHCASAISKGLTLFLSNDAGFDVVREVRRAPLGHRFSSG